MPYLIICAFFGFASLQVHPSPAPLPVPTATASPAPIGTPMPSSSPSPSPGPTPLQLPADAAPQIVDVTLSSTTLRGGDTFSGRVITSTNVASLEVRMAGQSINVPRTDFGIFALTYQVPHIPFFARGTYTAQIIARNAKGDSVERDLGVTLR